MQQNQVEEAIARYREHTQSTGRNDFEILQQMGLILLQKGIQSDDPQTFLMTLFGAGLSGSVGALEILERGLDIQTLKSSFSRSISSQNSTTIGPMNS